MNAFSQIQRRVTTCYNDVLAHTTLINNTNAYLSISRTLKGNSIFWRSVLSVVVWLIDCLEMTAEYEDEKWLASITLEASENKSYITAFYEWQ